MIPRWLAELLAAAMEALWVFAGVAMLAQVFAGGRTPSPWILIAAAMLAVLVSRLVRSFDLNQVALAVTGGVLSLLSIYLLVRLEYPHDVAAWELGWLADFLSSPGDALSGESEVIVGALAIFAIWARWLILVQNKLQPEDVRGSFSFGLLVFALAVLVRDDLESGQTVVRLVLPYVAIGLVAIAANQQVEAGRLGGLNIFGSWGVALLATLGGIFVLAGLAALVPATGLSEPLLPLWRGILLAGGVVLLIMALPFVILTEIFLILVPIEGLLGDLPQPEIQPQQLVEGEDDSGSSSWDWFFVSLRVLGGIALVVFVLILLSSLFLYLRRRHEDDEERESVSPSGSVVADLLSLLRGLRPQRSKTPDRTPDLTPNGLALRELYLGVVAETERRGIARADSLTPRRFVPAIETTFPSAGFGSRLTDQFELVRYGRAEISGKRVADLRREWKDLR